MKEEKMVVVRSKGTRKGFGEDLIFAQMEGYEGPCVEMEEKAAKNLVKSRPNLFELPKPGQKFTPNPAPVVSNKTIKITLQKSRIRFPATLAADGKTIIPANPTRKEMLAIAKKNDIFIKGIN